MAEKVKAKDTVTVYATGKGKHLDKVKAHKVHKIVAQKLVARGLAVFGKPGKGKQAGNDSDEGKQETV